ncbi:LysE family transporter [candidate division KSB1 bacterium]|nr:LysE family transporter [candidate division KSB1 bacterium]
MAYIISQTFSHGWKRTISAAFSPLLSDAPIIIVTLLLLSQIGDGFFKYLHIGGGIFLLYLACRAYKTRKSFEPGEMVQSQSVQRTLFSAAFVNILNPGPYIGWSLIVGPLFLKGWRETPVNGIALIIAFYSTMAVCLIGIIILFAFASRLGPKVNRISLGLSIIALTGFAAYQLWIGFNLL